MRSTSSSRAVTNSTGVQSPAARSSRQTSVPSISGRPTSSTIGDGLQPSCGSEPGPAVPLDVHAEALAGQVEPDQVGDRALVLDDEHQPLGRSGCLHPRSIGAAGSRRVNATFGSCTSRRSQRVSPLVSSALMTVRSLDTDYLVVGAGAMGMAFTDALIDHADVHVTLVDRRSAAGGHWLDAYPFVQLHQASQFYGVASTVLGDGSRQTQGPEEGLHQRARRAEIQSYYDRVLHGRFVGSGRVTFLGGSDYRSDGDAHLVTSRVSGETVHVTVRRRVVDATYLSPTIPATTPPPFGVAPGARVVAVNQLASLGDAPTRFVIVGSGKTATDGIVWLLEQRCLTHAHHLGAAS